MARIQTWSASNAELVKSAAETAKKPTEVRTKEENDQFDIFADEIRKVIPGGDTLSAEQLRDLSINLNLMNTRHAGTTIKSLNDATSYVGEEFQQGVSQSEATPVIPGPGSPGVAQPGKSGPGLA